MNNCLSRISEIALIVDRTLIIDTISAYLA